MKQFSRVIILLCLILSAVSISCACECPPRRSPRKELKVSKVVFAGEVVEANVGGENGFYLFRVERYWKGVGGEFITISGGKGLCNRSYRVGEKYLVYALEDGVELKSDTCMRTTLLAEAAIDLKTLGKGRAVRKPSAQFTMLKQQPNNSFNASGISLDVMRKIECF